MRAKGYRLDSGYVYELVGKAVQMSELLAGTTYLIGYKGPWRGGPYNKFRPPAWMISHERGKS